MSKAEYLKNKSVRRGMSALYEAKQHDKEREENKAVCSKLREMVKKYGKKDPAKNDILKQITAIETQIRRWINAMPVNESENDED